MELKNITEWVEEFSKIGLASNEQVTIILSPTVVYLPLLKEVRGVYLCAQDISPDAKGAHTGEIGAFQIGDFCRYCIVGHSERKEPLDIVLQKREACLSLGITPIVCFTKTENAKEIYQDNSFLAWEDPNNISLNGNYRDKDANDIRKGIIEIRKIIPEESILIYGGSVNRNNIKEISKISGIDGVLVGNASLDPNHFADIIRCYL